MTRPAQIVLQKLQFWKDRGPKTGAELADMTGLSIRQIQSAVEEIRTNTDERGRRYFVLGGMGEEDRGYQLTDDIEKMRECRDKYQRRAKTYFVNSQGMDAAIKYAMDVQGITGTLFERSTETGGRVGGSITN